MSHRHRRTRGGEVDGEPVVAQALERSALLNGDAVHGLVVGGRVWTLGEPADEAARQVRLGNANLCALAANLADAGFTPVIDWIVPDRAQLDDFLTALAPRPVLLVVLDNGAAACRHRNAARDAARDPDEQFRFDGHEALTAAMRDGFGDLGWWFDTADHTAEQTAAQLVTLAPRLARRGLGSAGAPARTNHEGGR